MNSADIVNLKRIVAREKKIMKEMMALLEGTRKIGSITEKEMLNKQVRTLKGLLKKENARIPSIILNLSVFRPLPPRKSVEVQVEKKPVTKMPGIMEAKQMPEIERLTLRRLKKGKREKSKFKKVTKPSSYIKAANKAFSSYSLSLTKENKFMTLDRALIKSNVQLTTASYLSVIFFTTAIAVLASILLFLFLLFFDVSVVYPFLSVVNESLVARLVKVLWIIPVVPIATFFLMYFYPFLEQKAIAHSINQELPFATIHMAAISGSMIEPTKIFDIIISTKEYPALEKEFTKLMNEINVYGYNLVNALRTVAFNSPSLKLAELLNGLSTTITSGGSLSDFFEEKAESLLFDHRLEREKETKSAETFMDIYVSIVIAAPMILMLLLMMIKISGIGIALSMQAISLIFVLGIAIVNIFFLAFLHIKQTA